MALFIECDELTEHEKQVRHELIYLLNPCLKFIFNQRPAFREYAYNSCRQTAIFSAVYLQNALPAMCTVYEGTFSDIINGRKVDYEHAFVIASFKKRELLVDISRTQRKLLFCITKGVRYPKVKGYEDAELLSYKKLDFHELFASRQPEFLTGKIPADVMYEALTLLENLKKKPKSEQIVFASKIYDEMTEIGGEFL